MIPKLISFQNNVEFLAIPSISYKVDFFLSGKNVLCLDGFGVTFYHKL